MYFIIIEYDKCHVLQTWIGGYGPAHSHLINEDNLQIDNDCLIVGLKNDQSN